MKCDLRCDCIMFFCKWKNIQHVVNFPAGVVGGTVRY
jgi:hypothetical protein